MRGKRDYPNGDTRINNLTRSIDAIKVGHTNIHEYNVGFQCHCQRDSLPTVVSFPDHTESRLLLQPVSNHLTKFGVVIRQQDIN